ncbi:hypothetical protein FB451DRAFT_1376648 [Mycena latifolia]|nr:hypothetical protein FB451DRAFT_1376648 [Mycena latifolia]
MNSCANAHNLQLKTERDRMSRAGICRTPDEPADPTFRTEELARLILFSSWCIATLVPTYFLNSDLTQRPSSNKSALLFVNVNEIEMETIYGANVKAAAFQTLADPFVERLDLNL